jgi:adenylate cyclase
LPLGSEAIDALLRDLLGDDQSVAPLGERIRARTGGNPFFIEEVVQALVESGHLKGRRGAHQLARSVDEVAIPASVQNVLAARIDRLAEREKQVLQAAAVIGKEFAEPILHRVMTDAGAHDAAPVSTAELSEALRALTQGEFLYEEALYPEAVYAFKHPLTQEVAYGSQLASRRVRLHATIARALEERAPERLDQQAALLAHHWDEAREPLLAARWHRRAAEWSGLANAEQTFRHLRQARELVQGLPLSAERDDLAAAAIGMLSTGARRGDAVGARPTADEALTLAAARGTRSDVVDAYVVRARIGLRAGAPCAEIEADLAEADALVATTGDRFAAPVVLMVRAELAERLGDAAARQRHLREAERLCREMGAPLRAEDVARLAKEHGC